MDKVVQFRPVEMIFVDAGHLVDLTRDRGAPHAEFIAFAALEEIVERLTAVEAAWRAGEFRRLARSVVGMSEQLGMQTVALVAGKVASVAETNDQAALAALVARLVRVGEGSLTAFGDLAHLKR